MRHYIPNHPMSHVVKVLKHVEKIDKQAHKAFKEKVRKLELRRQSFSIAMG